MLLKKHKTIILLKRQSIEVHSLNADPKTLTLPASAIDNLEVKSQKTLEKEILKFLVAEQINPEKALLLLSEEITFQKITAIKDPEKLEKAIEDFVEEIPLSNDVLEHQRFNINKGTLVIATNRGLIDGVRTSFESQEWKITNVLPETFFGKKAMDQVKLNTIFSRKSEFKELSLDFNQKPKTIKEKKRKENKGKKQKSSSNLPVLLAIFIILLGILGYMGYNFMVAKQVYEEVTEDEIPAVEKVMEVETEAEPEEIVINKEDYTIQVLNGTGIGGLAGSTKELLEAEKFINISVGNAPAYEEVESLIQYGDVPTELIDEIAEILFETFEDVVEKQEEELPFDIVITTGQLTSEEN